MNQSKDQVFTTNNLQAELCNLLKQLASIGGEISPFITLITNIIYIVIKDLKGDIL
jgi:hypothetical protein